MAKSKMLTCDPARLSEGVEFLRGALKDRNVSSTDITRTLLTAEEILNTMIAKAPGKEEEIKIEVGGILGNVEISFQAKGEPFDAADIESGLTIDQENEEANEIIRRMFNKLMGDGVIIKHSRGISSALLKVKKSYYAGLVYTMVALALGILTGLLMQSMLPAETSKAISTNVFVPIYTVFMNALKMIVAPLVFFSIGSSIADFGDIKALGRIAVKVVALYILTSMLAICVGYITYQIFPIGDPAVADAVSAEDAAATLAKGEGVKISIKDTLVGVVPTDIVTPFQKSDMLQIIFMAVCLGLAASALTRKYPGARELLNTMNALASKITTVLVSFIPLIVFCSMAKMMINMNLGSLMSVAMWVPVIYFGDMLMILVYLVLLIVFAGLNPFVFLKTYYPAMVAAFTFAASNPALPSSLRQCDELGVSPKVYSFSLPLGATINMDGSCISLIISALFFAKIFGIPVTGSVLVSLFIAIIVLSVGSPGVPGGNLVCIALLVPQIGVPAEAISLIMGLYPLVGMMQTCANVTGDAVVTTIVAKHEKLLDLDRFYGRGKVKA